MEEETSQRVPGEFSIPRELKIRILSGAILIPLAVGILYIGDIAFNSVLLMAAVIMSFEWKNIITNTGALKAGEKTRWELYGLFFIAIPILCLMWMRSLDVSYGTDGFGIILWLFSVVWATDIAAYFTGKKIGGPKLAKRISPNKTWSGLVGGIVAAALVGFIAAIVFNPPNKLVLPLLSAFLAVLEQASDLLESAVKRHFKVKDSGSIIPGHGGLLDRVDGFILLCPFVAILLLITGGAGLFK